MTPAEEADRIHALCKGDALRAVEMVHAQFGVLVLRTQVMLSLSGIVITVTGFSGRAIAETGVFARATVIAGLVLVLLAAAVAMAGVLRLKWITEILEEDAIATLRAAIRIRDEKSRFLKIAVGLFLTGFSLYVAAVAQLLIATPVK